LDLFISTRESATAACACARRQPVHARDGSLYSARSYRHSEIDDDDDRRTPPSQSKQNKTITKTKQTGQNNS